MWISKNKWNRLEKRIARLERQARNQQRDKERSGIIFYGDGEIVQQEKNKEVKTNENQRTAAPLLGTKS